MLKEKVKDIMKLDKLNDKKKIENLVVFLVILIVTILAINMIWKDDSKEKNITENENTKLATLSTEKSGSGIEGSNSNDMSKELEDILSNIKGVGKVKVLISYSESSEIVAMYNENKKETSTEEKDDSGGVRVITESDTQKDVIYKESNGEKEPITQKTINPKIEGAIITAEGADSADTKSNIIQAVEAVTGLATHKIQVFAMSENM